MKVAHEKLTYMLNNDFQPMLVNFRCANLGGGGGRGESSIYYEIWGGAKAAYIMKSGGPGKSSIYYEIWGGGAKAAYIMKSGGGGGRKQHIIIIMKSGGGGRKQHIL